ncbi:PAS domain-containing protein [Sphingomonas desiccabilis]|uniref:PAS domain-containing protein n=1 Tax=Sphingomonas desiccabilis TaxID=429134 RepID=A0A4Q2IXM4_9SPHN|nr:PAS domain-containing protein [Sphingomonas desiccabilis]MBB3910797.1 PAS domain S-box-containing protein [Sphingomonas desiccabilis]RXZ35405.1 PAS domain-containing protein [Sphingomonas desiccabilis]
MSRLQRATAYACRIEAGAFFDTLDECEDAVLITEAALAVPGPRIVYVNAALERLCGYSRAELIGNTPRLLQGYDTDREELERLRRELESQGCFEGEVMNYDKRRQEYVLGWTVVPIRDTAGAVRNWLSLQIDVLRESAGMRAQPPAA